MEERKMTEKESLELISQMITKSRVRLERQAGWPLVLWGVAAALMGIAVWAGVKFTGNAAWYTLWFLLLIVFPIHWIWAKRHTENVRDYVTETVGWVWFVFGASCMVFAALYALGVTSLPINVCITLLLGFATTVTGMMLKRWLVMVLGVLTICLFVPLMAVVVSGVDTILLSAGIVVLDIMLPGIIMCRADRREVRI